MHVQAGQADLRHQLGPSTPKADGLPGHHSLEDEGVGIPFREDTTQQVLGALAEKQHPRRAVLGRGRQDLARCKIHVIPAALEQLGFARS